MTDTVGVLRGVSPELGRDVPVIIGGGIVDEQMCRRTGADLWANDAAEGVRLIRGTVAKLRGSLSSPAGGTSGECIPAEAAR